MTASNASCKACSWRSVGLSSYGAVIVVAVLADYHLVRGVRLLGVRLLGAPRCMIFCTSCWHNTNASQFHSLSGVRILIYSCVSATCTDSPARPFRRSSICLRAKKVR